MHPYVKLLRPRQWIKNAFVFAPLFFAHRYLQPEAWAATALAALAFLGASCVVYVCNDIADIGEDRLHPVKKNRPLASGQVSAMQAGLLAAFIAAATLPLLAWLPAPCLAVIGAYLALNAAYTRFLKHIAILDVFLIASFYVLRVLMGCYALDVAVSPWIILTTFLLALFLGFGKRYHEMGFPDYAAAKPNLRHYTRALLGQLMTLCAAATLITYALYTVDLSRQIAKIEIVYTVAFVAFGLFRYLQAVYVHGQGGEPESALLSDRLHLYNIALWLGVTLWIIGL